MTLAPNADRTRLLAVAAFVRCLRTGERAAVENIWAHLAENVCLQRNGVSTNGREAVARSLAGQWPLTPVLGKGDWGHPVADGAKTRVEARFDSLGAAPRNYVLTLEFDADDRIVVATETFDFPQQAEPVPRIPPHVGSAIDRALANGTPVVLSYVDDLGYPALSLRGSVQVWTDTQLCAWLRDANSGLVRAVRAGRPLGLLYRDSPTRTTLVMRGRGRISSDEATRAEVYRRAPEVEQTHDVGQRGAALLIDIERIVGTHPLGPVRVEPTVHVAASL